MGQLARRAFLQVAPKAKWKERGRQAAAILKSFQLTVSAQGELTVGLDVDAIEGMADSGISARRARSVFELRRLTQADARAVLAFEMENRAYFARSVTDRGDAFYERHTDHHDALLAQQAAGVCAFHVLVEADGSVIGRVNLYDLERGNTSLGYRIAERVTGRGVATAAVRSVVELARDEYGLNVLFAEVSDTNVSSRRVLEKAGFVVMSPTEINAKPATRYKRDLHIGWSGV